jgi:type III secretory pathway component EscR
MVLQIPIFRSDTIMDKKTKDKIAEYSVYVGIFLIIAFFVFKPILMNVYEQIQHDNETITNKDLEDFHNWESKQDQSKWENQDSGN